MRRVFLFIDALMRDLSDRINTPSPLGGQLERFKNDTQRCVSLNPFRHEERSHLLALRILIWNSLSKPAQQALVAKNNSKGWKDSVRIVHESELIPNTKYNPPVFTTKIGEEIATEDEQDSPPPLGYRKVKRSVPVFYTNAEIAEQLGLTKRQLVRVLSKAYDVIEHHPLFEVVMKKVP